MYGIFQARKYVLFHDRARPYYVTLHCELIFVILQSNNSSFRGETRKTISNYKPYITRMILLVLVFYLPIFLVALIFYNYFSRTRVQYALA